MTTPSHIPTGTYPAHAEVHLLDLEQAADELIARLPGNRRQTETLAREGGVSVVLMAMEAGDELDEHSVASSVTIHLLRGHATFKANGENRSLRPGQVMLLQPAVRHALRAEAQSVVLLTITGGTHG